MSCNCCDQPPGTSVAIECESYSATHTEPWCGYNSFIPEDPPKKYAKKEWKDEADVLYGDEVYDYTYSDEEFSYSIHHEMSAGYISGRSGTYTIQKNEAGICVESSTQPVCYGQADFTKASATETFDGGSSTREFTSEALYNADCTQATPTQTCKIDGESVDVSYCGSLLSWRCGRQSGPINSPKPADTATVRYTSWTHEEYSLTEGNCTGTDHIHSYTKETLSEEVPKPALEDVLSSAMDKIPSESNGAACSAFKSVSTDKLTVAVRKAKIKLTHGPTGTCYLKVWLRKRFRPSGTTGASDVVTPFETYVWSASGNPCFASPSKPPGDDDNKIESSEYTLDVPDAAGTLTVEIARYSFLPDYTPDEALESGTRPSPDTKPNGYPL